VRVVVLAEVEDGRDVRMGDARSDACFVEEHLDERFVLDEMRMDLLDGDPFLEAARTIHACKMHACHTADADLVDDAVAPEEVRASCRSNVRHRAAGRTSAA